MATTKALELAQLANSVEVNANGEISNISTLTSLDVSGQIDTSTLNVTGQAVFNNSAPYLTFQEYVNANTTFTFYTGVDSNKWWVRGNGLGGGNALQVVGSTNNVDILNDLSVGGNATLGQASVQDSLTITGTYPVLRFTDTDSDPDFTLVGGSGQLGIYNETDNVYTAQFKALATSFYNDVDISTNQPRLRLKETDTTDLDVEVLNSGGTFYIRRLNDDNSVGANMLSLDGASKLSVASVGVTNIVTNRVVKFNGSILDDSIITDDGTTVSVAGALSVSTDIDVTGTITADNLILSGDLLVQGNTTSINTNDLSIEDLNITLAAGSANSAVADGAGITVEGANAQITYASVDNTWNLNKKLNVNFSGTTQGLNLVRSDVAGSAIVEFSNTTGLKNSIGYDGGRGAFVITDSAYNPQVIVKASGNVGMGTNDPSANLHVYRASGQAGVKVEAGTNDAIFFANATNNWGLWGYDNTRFSIGTNNTEKVTVLGSGNVGINTVDPKTRLHIYGVDGEALRWGYNNTTYAKLTAGTAGARIDVTGANNGYGMHFSMDDDIKMTILPNGNIGMGTNAPDTALHIKRSGQNVSLLTLENYHPDITGLGNVGNYIDFKMTDDNATATPQVRIGMHVYDNDGVDAGIPSEGAGNFVVYTMDPGTDQTGNGVLSEKLRVTEKGAVGIGTTLPTSKLTVRGSTNPLNDGTNAIRLEHQGGPMPGDLGAGIVFAQEWYSLSDAIVRAGGIYGYKSGGNGTFGGGLKFYVQPSSGADMNLAMQIHNSLDTTMFGNVGIGISPTQKLHVSGNIFSIDGYASFNGYKILRGASHPNFAAGSYYYIATANPPSNGASASFDVTAHMSGVLAEFKAHVTVRNASGTSTPYVHVYSTNTTGYRIVGYRNPDNYTIDFYLIGTFNVNYSPRITVYNAVGNVIENGSLPNPTTGITETFSWDCDTIETVDLYASGNVGIGVSAPANKLEVEVNNDGGVAWPIRVSNLGSSIGSGSGIQFAMDGVNNVDAAQIWAQRDDSPYHASSLHFSTRQAGTGTQVEALTIDKNQRVGIGTATIEDDARLQVGGSEPVLAIRDTVTQNATKSATLELLEHGAGSKFGGYWKYDGNLNWNYIGGIQSNNYVNSIQYPRDGSVLQLNAGNAQQVYITSSKTWISNSVSIGLSTPSSRLDVQEPWDSGRAALTIRDNTTTSNVNIPPIDFSHSGDRVRARIQAVNAGAYGDKAIVFYNYDASSWNDTSDKLIERMRIHHTGNVGIGTTGAPAEKLEVLGNIRISRTATYNAYWNQFISHANTSEYGTLYFQGDTSTGGIIFRTGGVTTRPITFEADGDVHITGSGSTMAATNLGNATLKIGGTRTAPGLGLDSNEIIFGNDAYIGTATAQDILFRTNGASNRLRITSDDNVIFGGGLDADPGNGNTNNGVAVRSVNNGTTVMLSASRSSGNALRVNRNTTPGEAVYFAYNGLNEGSISVDTTGTTYNTTSDRRLKDNIVAITDGKEKLLAMKPVTFNFKADENKSVLTGFIAQEMQEVVPEAVTGEADGEAMLSMDYGRITPVIVAALQDALKEIEELKTRIAQLEDK